MNCENPVRLTKNLSVVKYPEGLLVPCGKCVQCRIQKRKEWSVRLYHELDYWNDSVFLTLTYDDKSVPENMSLKKKDLQDFFKRLRMSVNGRTIKYFACGEYGGETERPHYHSIIYGVGLQEDDKKAVMDSWKKCDWKNDKIYTRSFGIVEPDSIRYVCQYIDKKFTGELAEKEYKDRDREPVFKICSQGLGKNFCIDNKDQLIENKGFTVRGVPHSFPRYYLKKLDLENSDFRKDISEEKEKRLTKRLTGHELTDDEYIRLAPADEYMKYYEKVKAIRKQKSKDIMAKNQYEEFKTITSARRRSAPG